MENLEEFIKERMKENKELFDDEEIKLLNETSIKLYIIGLLDGKKIYT